MLQVCLREPLACFWGRSESLFVVIIQDWVMDLSSSEAFTHTIPRSVWHQPYRQPESMLRWAALLVLEFPSTCHLATFHKLVLHCYRSVIWSVLSLLCSFVVVIPSVSLWCIHFTDDSLQTYCIYVICNFWLQEFSQKKFLSPHKFW